MGEVVSAYGQSKARQGKAGKWRDSGWQRVGVSCDSGGSLIMVKFRLTYEEPEAPVNLSTIALYEPRCAEDAHELEQPQQPQQPHNAQAVVATKMGRVSERWRGCDE